MTRQIIAILVGAILMFGYQAMSWMVLPIHTNSLKHTPQQDSLMAVLSGNLQEEGLYYLPLAAPGTSEKDAQAIHETNEGKPWAIVEYHPVQQTNMGKSMGVGFFLSLLAIAIAVFIISRGNYPSFLSRFMLCVVLGLFVSLQGELTDWNWWQTPVHFMSGVLLDHLLGWAIVGIWLGFILRPQSGWKSKYA